MAQTSYSVAPFQTGIDVPADIAAIHLGIRNWQVETGQNTFRNILESQADLKALDQYYVEPGGNFFIARGLGSSVIGFLGLRNDGEGNGVFKRLAVVPEWHRKGVARALVGEAMDWAGETGFTKLSLQTNVGENARPLYEDFGFTVVGFVDEEEDWLMERSLR